MSQLAPCWSFDVDRGPDWVFIRAHAPTDGQDSSVFADEIWAVLEQHLTYRVVLELDQIDYLDSSLVGQLVKLSKRVHTHGGLIRLCGLSAANQNVLGLCRLEAGLPHYAGRGEAVMGHRPAQPR